MPRALLTPGATYAFSLALENFLGFASASAPWTVAVSAGAIPDRYPERLRRVVVYPLPGWAKTLIGLVKRLLEPVTRDKIEVLAGSDAKDAPCPAGLAEHVALDAIPEHARAARGPRARGRGGAGGRGSGGRGEVRSSAARGRPPGG